MKNTHRTSENLRNNQPKLENQVDDQLTVQELEDEVLQIICGGLYVDGDALCW